MIRRATLDDRDRIVEMGQRFAAETKYGGLIAVNPERLTVTVGGLLESPDAAVFVSGSDALTGMIVMSAYEHPFSGERMAFEFVWWIEPEARGTGDGVRLLHAAEQWARDEGIGKMQMVAPDPRIGEFYARMGYSPIETSYQRSL